MLRIRFTHLALFLFASACASSSQGVAPGAAGSSVSAGKPRLEYPDAERGEVVDEYHGTRVADPYRWLEDSDSPETRDWIEAENALTQSWLAGVEGRDAIRRRVEELWTYERFGTPRKRGGAYFFTYGDGKLDQDVLCRLTDLDGEPRVVLDPNGFSDDGTVSLGGTAVSESGRYLAYGLSDGGSDWRTWRVRDLESGADTEDVLEWIKFSGASWTHDDAGFFYARFPESDDPLTATNENQVLCYHRLGTPQSEDRVVYADPDHPRRGVGAQVAEDGRLLELYVTEGTRPENGLYFLDLADQDTGFVEAFRDFDAQYRPIGSDGWTVWLWTDRDAPKGRVVRCDPRRVEETWTEILPEADDVLESASVVGNRLVAQYLADAKSVVRVHDLEGKLVREVELPGIGSTNGFEGELGDSETFFGFSSYATPPSVFRYDVETGEVSLFRRPRLPFRHDRYETRQVFYESGDGTRVPMFLTERKGRPRDGAAPVLLYGYGGFDISLTPHFSPAIAAWLEMGGTYAVANLRGGGEYGRAWHEAGTLERKQNVFDDFIAAAEWLVAEGYTKRERLAIFGGSNGGLLVGACLTQRPELFGAALPAVGVLDMLRYHRFTIGWAWASDYGTADDPEMFPVLAAYSPLHNVHPGTEYPATLITTGDHDDRVVPAHSFKFAATLQRAQAGPEPILIRIETRAGHGAGKSRTQAIEETADRWAFLARVLGMRVPGS